MNIIKQIFEIPDTPSGKKRLNNLITRLGLGKKIKGDLMKDVVSGELGGGASASEVKEYYYLFNSSKYIEEYESKYGTIDKTNVDVALMLAYSLFEYKYVYDSNDSRDDYLEKNIPISTNTYPRESLARISGFVLRSPVCINYPYLAIGNAKEITYKFVDLIVPDKDSPDAIYVIEMANVFLNNLTEVSKEEFYSNFKLEPIII